MSYIIEALKQFKKQIYTAVATFATIALAVLSLHQPGLTIYDNPDQDGSYKNSDTYAEVLEEDEDQEDEDAEDEEVNEDEEELNGEEETDAEASDETADVTDPASSVMPAADEQTTDAEDPEAIPHKNRNDINNE